MSEQIITRDIANWIPKSYDESTRSVRVVAITENPISEHDVRGAQYFQIVLVDGVQLPANQQVPLLDSHNWRSVTSVLGSARNFIVNGNALECDVFFSSTPMGIEVAQKVKEGHLTDFSIGFMPVEVVWVSDKEQTTIRGRSFIGPAQVITKWSLLELSITAIGKDRHAKVRIWDGELGESPGAPAAETESISSDSESADVQPEPIADVTPVGLPQSELVDLSQNANQDTESFSQSDVEHPETLISESIQETILSEPIQDIIVENSQNDPVDSVQHHQPMDLDASSILPDMEKKENFTKILIYIGILLALLASAFIQ